MILTPETGAGVEGANSYCSVEDADAYLDQRLYATAWTNLTSDVPKMQALAWATRLIDENVAWLGAAVMDRETPAWPRIGMFDANGVELASTTLPAGLVDATAELALLLIRDDRVAKAEEALASLSVPKGSRSYAQGHRYSVVPPGILDKLASFIQPAGGGRIMRVA